ncbi:MAG: SDR family oxidoreductase [Pacificimonas sp.]|jgi:NAD(P)-dependent dehydrogenase (short-subunit alcohol dehydrogenase family)|nr:SDR family oxidoreductase [Pacificimonas sp.]
MPDMDRRQLLGATALAGAALTSGATIAAGHQGGEMADLTGQTVLITGCSSGFGNLAATLFARRGAKVIATMRNLPRREADDMLQVVADENLDIHVVEIDVTSDESVAAGVAEAERLAGGALDILVNNAGIAVGTTVELQDMDATELIFDTNVFGPQRVSRAALPRMREAGKGLIFNVSSQLGRVIIPGFGLYSASKFALEAQSEQMAYELAQHGIEVCVIQPGGYPTEIWENSNQLTQALLDRTDEARKDAYAAIVATAIRSESGSSTDPMDVPNAMLEVAAMPAGTRPLRRPVHPGTKPQLAINEVSAKTQLAMLGGSPYGPAIRAVQNEA